MGRPLTAGEWAATLDDFEHSAFRLELQPAYRVDHESGLFARFMAGDRTPPLDDQASLDWFAKVRRHVAAGKRFERVRVFEDPPTDYQRWLRWVSRWNVEAGEHQRYMTRRKAYDVGLLPAAGDEDWWLFDSARLAVMRFGPDGRKVSSELVTDPERVVQACMWRDLAVHHSAPGDVRGQAA